MHQLFAILFLLFAPKVVADNQQFSLSATFKLMAALSISTERDLDFGEGFTSDGSKTLLPQEGAKFVVTGEPNRCFSIALPNKISLIRSRGSAQGKKIDVSGFFSDPSGYGSLGPTGNQSLFVGATRDAIPTSQPSGDYAASFTVVVTYQ